VQAGDAGQRARVLGELTGELEAFGLGIIGVLAALDRLGGNLDSGDVRLDEAQRLRRAHEQDRRQDRALLGEPGLDGALHEVLELLADEAALELQEARASAHLLQCAVDAVVVRRRAGILDGADEEVRRRIDLAAGEIGTACHRSGGRDELRRVEVEDAARLGLVAGGDVVAGEAADVLDAVQCGACDLCLEREAVAVAAGELHDGLHAELLQCDRDRERRRVCVRRRVVGRIDGVDPVLIGLEVAVHRVEAA
jgi:hypothetical protein